MIFTSISYLLFLPFIVVAYYLWPARRTPPPRTSPPTPLLGGEGRTPPPTPPRTREGSAGTRNEGGNSFQWIWLAVASVAYYLSFIPIFFTLIGALAVGNYFGGRWLFNANERGNGKQALTILVLLNIVVLAFFKYFNFFFPGFKVDLYFVDWFYRIDPINRMIIPLGLSYLVFAVLSYHFKFKQKESAFLVYQSENSRYLCSHNIF